MEEKNKERYEAPEVVVVELKVEGRILSYSIPGYENEDNI